MKPPLLRALTYFRSLKPLVPASVLLLLLAGGLVFGWVAHSLEKLVYEIKVDKEVCERAKATLDRMLAVTGEPKGAALSGY